eukprot:TRINITY_DN50994_c0_g1_i1.p1 TRINITY_DN50994_c0_g1~~TRINITY_DN50994_c0_g1_i1.p1  ORF type:complete len:457 (+),score=68.66 TRINITY_DN50994_c0_g1_i1:123-1493(+)
MALSPLSTRSRTRDVVTVPIHETLQSLAKDSARAKALGFDPNGWLSSPCFPPSVGHLSVLEVLNRFVDAIGGLLRTSPDVQPAGKLQIGNLPLQLQDSNGDNCEPTVQVKLVKPQSPTPTKSAPPHALAKCEDPSDTWNMSRDRDAIVKAITSGNERKRPREACDSGLGPHAGESGRVRETPSCQKRYRTWPRGLSKAKKGIKFGGARSSKEESNGTVKKTSGRCHRGPPGAVAVKVHEHHTMGGVHASFALRAKLSLHKIGRGVLLGASAGKALKKENSNQYHLGVAHRPVKTASTKSSGGHVSIDVSARQSGVRGVQWHQSRQRWMASYMKDGKQVRVSFAVGHYRLSDHTDEEANAAALKAAIAFRESKVASGEARVHKHGHRSLVTSGVKGVNWNSKRKSWKAHIVANGQKIYAPTVKPANLSPSEIDRTRLIAIKQRLDLERKYFDIKVAS